MISLLILTVNNLFTPPKDSQSFYCVILRAYLEYVATILKSKIPKVKIKAKTRN